MTKEGVRLHLFHKWSKWSAPYACKVEYVEFPGKQFDQERQAKTCSLCGKMKERIVG